MNDTKEARDVSKGTGNTAGHLHLPAAECFCATASPRKIAKVKLNRVTRIGKLLKNLNKD
jgi:hypothetical protein